MFFFFSIATACWPNWRGVIHPVSSSHSRWPPVVAGGGGGTPAAPLIKHLTLHPSTRLISGSDSHTTTYASMFTHVTHTCTHISAENRQAYFQMIDRSLQLPAIRSLILAEHVLFSYAQRLEKNHFLNIDLYKLLERD